MVVGLWELNLSSFKGNPGKPPWNLGRSPTSHRNIGILHTLVSGIPFCALEPERRILMFMWSLEPLKEGGSLKKGPSAGSMLDFWSLRLTSEIGVFNP